MCHTVMLQDEPDACTVLLDVDEKNWYKVHAATYFQVRCTWLMARIMLFRCQVVVMFWYDRSDSDSAVVVLHYVFGQVMLMQLHVWQYAVHRRQHVNAAII